MPSEVVPCEFSDCVVPSNARRVAKRARACVATETSVEYAPRFIALANRCGASPAWGWPSAIDATLPYSRALVPSREGAVARAPDPPSTSIADCERESEGVPRLPEGSWVGQGELALDRLFGGLDGGPLNQRAPLNEGNEVGPGSDQRFHRH